MIGVIITKPNELPLADVAVMIQSCKHKVVEQLQLERTPELDTFGLTAIEDVGGCSSVERYVATINEMFCADYFLTTDANGRPLCFHGGTLLDDGTFEIRMVLHNADATGSKSYIYDADWYSEDLIAQHQALGCSRLKALALRPHSQPDYVALQGWVDVSVPDEDFITLQGPWGW